MPGNIVCGICGAVRYYAFILQAKKFGTFSCEPCRKFISKTIKKCNNTSEDDELFPCLTGSGLCVVPPVLRATSGQTKKAEASVPRCQACWLKLCLIGELHRPENFKQSRPKNFVKSDKSISRKKIFFCLFDFTRFFLPGPL